MIQNDAKRCSPRGSKATGVTVGCYTLNIYVYIYSLNEQEPIPHVDVRNDRGVVQRRSNSCSE